MRIFAYLNDVDLANVGAVCQQFQILSENVFKKTHTGRCGCEVYIETNRIDWKPVVCRFRNVNTTVRLIGPTAKTKKKNFLDFIEEFLSESLENLTINLERNVMTELKFRKKISQTEIFDGY